MSQRKSAARSRPISARMFEAIAARGGPAGQNDHRRELLAGVAGAVIEVGAGSGLTFPFYPAAVTRLVAIEPERHLRNKAVAAAARATVPVAVVDATADALPFGDGEFDVGVFSLVLCSVPDQAQALREMRRVIKAGGELRFYEHVVADDPRVRRLQRALDPVWSRLGGGCHLTRDTASAIGAAGFELTALREFEFKPSVLATPVAKHVIGRARRV